jgi:hypothetical protein
MKHVTAVDGNKEEETMERQLLITKFSRLVTESS